MSESNQPTIDIRGLHHSYKRQQALRDVSFSVEQGSIHGFVGPNGAGKTTTLKILATLLKPQRGTVRVFGFEIVGQYKSVRRKIGFMPDHFSLYRQMTVQEYLDFFAAAYGLDLQERTRVVGDVLVLTDMESRRNDLIKGLSRGMQQRVSLARVLVHDPALLLLDEPASGLDPRARIELMDIIRELRRMGKTIFISSHILSELAMLCDSVTILDRGTVRYSGSISGLSQGNGETADYLRSNQTGKRATISGQFSQATNRSQSSPPRRARQWRADTGFPGNCAPPQPGVYGSHRARRAAGDHGSRR